MLSLLVAVGVTRTLLVALLPAIPFINPLLAMWRPVTPMGRLIHRERLAFPGPHFVSF